MLTIHGHTIMPGDPVRFCNGDSAIVGYFVQDGGRVGVRTPHGSVFMIGFARLGLSELDLRPADAMDRQRIDALLEDKFRQWDANTVQRGED